MEIKEFIERYIGKENYFYCLRGKLCKEQLLIYYYGVKMFKIEDNKFIPTIKFFLPNSKKDIKEITLQELINIEKKLQSWIDNYSNNLDNLTRNSFLKFFTYPLEIEYRLNSKEIIEKIKKTSRGKEIFIPRRRIDSICIDNNVVNMIEIKIGAPAIAGLNGIHKHVLDIAYCIKNKIIEPDDFNKIINDRAEILEAYKIKNEMNNCVDTLQYNIICSYKDDKEKQEVLAKLDKIYKLSNRQALLMTKSGVESKSQKAKDKTANIIEKYKELANMNLEQLLKYLDKDLNCKTKIYIANAKYTVIEPYDSIK